MNIQDWFPLGGTGWISLRPRDSQEIVDRASQVVPVVKNLPASAGDLRDGVRSPGQEDPLKEEMATHFSILAWKIPWTEEPGGLQSMGCKESDTTEQSRSTQTSVG